MTIYGPGIYHIYNRGNNQQTIFFSDENYLYFLRKCHRYLKPVSEIFAWCLMPNHFHFLIHVTEKSLVPIKTGGITMPALTNGFRLLLSSYAKGINVEQNRTGNLFQQKTKSKLVSDNADYSVNAFHYYIHYNPFEAGLVKKPEDWPYSSLQDYLLKRNGQLCNKTQAIELLGLSEIELNTNYNFPTDIIKKIY